MNPDADQNAHLWAEIARLNGVIEVALQRLQAISTTSDAGERTRAFADKAVSDITKLFTE